MFSLIYFVVYCLIPKHLGMYLFSIDSLLHFTVVREYILYDLKPVKCTDICLRAKYFSYFGEGYMCSREECLFSSCYLWYSVLVNYVKFIPFSNIFVFFCLLLSITEVS